MANGNPLQRKGNDNESASQQKYDHLKELVKLAAKNGWDIESLGLVSKDLPSAEPVPLTKKQFQERNRKIKKVLNRFSKALTPPVPPDLEDAIRSRDTHTWLPWEAEAIEKIDRWRKDIQEIKPDIIDELLRIWGLGSSSRQ